MYDATVAEIKREVLRAERRAGDGSQMGGTGFTIIKRRLPPIAQLVDGGYLASEELQAAGEVLTAFCSLTEGLWLRSPGWELRAAGHDANLIWSHRRAMAVAHYREWADWWSIQLKRKSNPTLPIVIAAVVDEQSMRGIAADHDIHRDTVRNRIVAGLHDYAEKGGVAMNVTVQESLRIVGLGCKKAAAKDLLYDAADMIDALLAALREIEALPGKRGAIGKAKTIAREMFADIN